jgi:hypothetical protein
MLDISAPELALFILMYGIVVRPVQFSKVLVKVLPPQPPIGGISFKEEHPLNALASEVALESFHVIAFSLLQLSHMLAAEPRVPKTMNPVTSVRL